MTRVININRAPYGWQDNPEYVYIGRSGKGMDGYFGNPISRRENESRSSLLKRYRSYLEERVHTDAEFVSRLRELKGKTLVCFCKPKSCHGDILKEFVDKLND